MWYDFCMSIGNFIVDFLDVSNVPLIDAFQTIFVLFFIDL